MIELIKVLFIVGGKHHKGETKSTIVESLKTFSFTTDNKVIEKNINSQLDDLEELLATKYSYLEDLKNGFNKDQFLELRAKAVFLRKDEPKKLRKKLLLMGLQILNY
jgi:hypothetical protein